MYLYEKAFGSTQFKFGYASAIAWCLVLLIVVVSLVNFLIVRRIRSAELMVESMVDRDCPRSRRRAPAAAGAQLGRRFSGAGPLTYLFLVVVARAVGVPALLVVRRRVARQLGGLGVPAGPDARARSSSTTSSRLFNSGEVNVNFWTALAQTRRSSPRS